MADVRQLSYLLVFVNTKEKGAPDLKNRKISDPSLGKRKPKAQNHSMRTTKAIIITILQQGESFALVRRMRNWNSLALLERMSTAMKNSLAVLQ